MTFTISQTNGDLWEQMKHVWQNWRLDLLSDEGFNEPIDYAFAAIKQGLVVDIKFDKNGWKEVTFADKSAFTFLLMKYHN